MNRRSVFASIIGFVTGFTLKTKSDEPKPFDPTVPNKDSLGNNVVRVYRESDHGVWMEIETKEVKEGDNLICIGQDGRRLWRADSLKVVEILKIPADPPDIISNTMVDFTCLISGVGTKALDAKYENGELP